MVAPTKLSAVLKAPPDRQAAQRQANQILDRAATQRRHKPSSPQRGALGAKWPACSWGPIEVRQHAFPGPSAPDALPHLYIELRRQKGLRSTRPQVRELKQVQTYPLEPSVRPNEGADGG